MIARYTLVCAIEKGAWKLVQAHTSLPASNIETHGFEHHAMNALLAEVAKGFDLAQREGVATIVFTDIVGSSALAAATGDRDWAKRIAGHFDAMGEIVEAAGGEMVKSLGDGTMSSFSSTVAALSASRRMQAQTSEDTLSPPLKLRIGMHRGDVIQTADDLFGSVVNKAARVAGVAEAGEIRVSDEVRLAALDDAACRAAIEDHLKRNILPPDGTAV